MDAGASYVRSLNLILIGSDDKHSLASNFSNFSELKVRADS
jgi:hypothetical protein